jgi:hypothetical protein
MSTGEAPRTDLAVQLDSLRIAVSKVDALARSTEEFFDNTSWSSGEVDLQRVERIAQMIGSVAEAAEAAVAVVDRSMR